MGNGKWEMGLCKSSKRTATCQVILEDLSLFVADDQ